MTHALGEKIKGGIKMSEKRGKRKIINPVDEVINNTEEINEVLEAKEEIVVKGIVKGCMNLNVRKEPSMDSEILGAIPRDTELIIVDDETEGWYKVKVKAKGIGMGFCMSKYITVKL